MLHVEPLLRNLDRISSRNYNKSQPRFEFLSNLNWAEENESFSL